MSTTATSKVSTDELLKEACARNVSAELHYSPMDGPVIIGRTRFLALTDEHVLADKPAYVDDRQVIPNHQPITVLISLRGTRYQFESAIEAGRTFVRLNQRKRVAGITLRRPGELVPVQRRQHLRLSVASLDPIPVQLVRIHPEIADACRVNEEIIPGRMVNVSVGGVSVLVRRRHLPQAGHNECFFLTFALPGTEGEFCMAGSVRQTRVIEASNSLRLGFAFHRWGGTEFTVDQQLITRFIAEEERRLLRRRR